MAQVKELVPCFKFATQQDVLFNVPKMLLEEQQEMEMAHREIVLVDNFATGGCHVLLNVRKKQ